MADRPLPTADRSRQQLAVPLGAAGARTGAYRLSRALVLLFFASTVDVVNFLDRGNQFRYAILLIPIAVAAPIWIRNGTTYVRRMRAVDRPLLLLWIFGMVGTIYGIVVLHSSTTARPIFLPMAVGFLYLLVPDHPTEAEVWRLVKAVALIGVLYIVLGAAVNTQLIPGLLKYRQFRNAQFAAVAVGLTGTAFLRRWTLLISLVVLAVFNFLAYPSATSILATMGMLITLFVTRPTASSMRPYVVGVIVAFGILVALLNLPTGVAILNDYFSFVHKVNATYGRLSVWSQGIAEFARSPFIGRVFSGGTVAVATRLRAGSQIQIPYHNDYVLFLAEGGLIGFGLLIAWIVGLELTLLRGYRGFLQANMQAHATAMRLLLVGLNSFLVAAAFNPVMEGMSRSATIFGFYGVAMMLGRPPGRAARVSRPRRPAWVD